MSRPTGKSTRDPIARFKKRHARGGILHVGPMIGVLHRGLPAMGDQSTVFEDDYAMPKDEVPDGAEFVELVSVVAVLRFTNSSGKPVDVPLNALETWSGCDWHEVDKKWHAHMHVEFHNLGINFNWDIGFIQSFFFFGKPPKGPR